MNNQSRNDLTHIIYEVDGDLGVIEFEFLPFLPKRFFWLKGVDNNTTRANHAHRTCHQLLVCQQGTVTATVTGGDGMVSVHEMGIGSTIYLMPLYWLELTKFSADSVIGVFASEPYKLGEYITKKEELLELWRHKHGLKNQFEVQ